MAKTADVQGQFDVISRPVEKPDYSIYKEEPMTEQPMNSFVDLSDGENGFALLNEGLKGYEADDDVARTLYLSLLRCYPLHMYITEFDISDYSQIDKGSQCLGKHSFHYAIMPHKGNWKEANVWQASEQFNLSLQAALTAPSPGLGHEALEKSFIEFSKDGLHVSAIKRSEDDSGWVIRLFNPYDETFNVKIRINGGFAEIEPQSPVERLKSRYVFSADKVQKWSKVEEVTLEELPLSELKIDNDGWVELNLGKKNIKTIKVG